MTTQRDLDTASNQSAFLPVGHQMRLPALPELAASRFTDLEQQQAPDQPRTRLIKDVLRVGQWHYVDEQGRENVWDVSEQTLHDLANNFKRYQELGNAINFVWNHSDDNRDAISPVDQLIVADGVLWASGYFTPEQAKDLQNPARKVSIRALENTGDGNGNGYNNLPGHIAVVERPVIPGQGPFRQLSQKQQRAIALSLLKPARAARTIDMAMDFETVKTGLNTLFEAVGMEQLMIPDHVTDEVTFDQWIKDAVAFIKPGESVDTDDGDAPMDDVQTETEPVGEPAMSMSQKPGGKVDLAATIRKAVADEVAPLKKELAAFRSKEKNAAKEQFEARVIELGQAGLTGKEAERLTLLGKTYGYDMKLLEGAEHLPGVNMSRIAKSHRNGSAPDMEATGRLDDETLAEELKKRGKDPAKMPTSRR